MKLPQNDIHQNKNWVLNILLQKIHLPVEPCVLTMGSSQMISSTQKLLLEILFLFTKTTLYLSIGRIRETFSSYLLYTIMNVLMCQSEKMKLSQSQPWSFSTTHTWAVSINVTSILATTLWAQRASNGRRKSSFACLSCA